MHTSDKFEVRILLVHVLFLHSDVNIPFVWMNYRPLTECDEEDTDISRTPSEGSPFAISPSSGTIGAKQAATFVVCFRPEMVNLRAAVCAIIFFSDNVLYSLL